MTWIPFIDPVKTNIYHHLYDYHMDNARQKTTKNRESKNKQK